MAQALDARRYELAGEPFPVAEHVGSYLAMGFFSASANGVLAYRSGASATGSARLVWFDREGKSQGTVGPPAFYLDMALSPDEKRVAVAQGDETGNRDLWIIDVARNVPTRFTFDPAQDRSPVWSPDGTRLVFGSDRRSGGIYDIYRKDAGYSGNEELFLKSGAPLSWSPDGRNLLYVATDPKTKADLWVLPDPAGAAGGSKPTPYLQTPFNEASGQFSPDGRWIAYASDDAVQGQYQIYVQSFPPGNGKFQISTGAGGTQPRWRRDGKELFYIAADGKLTAVEVKTAPRFEPGVPKPLFNPQILGGGVYSSFRYSPAADGKRFLCITTYSAANSSPSEPITVVLNWTAGLKH